MYKEDEGGGGDREEIERDKREREIKRCTLLKKHLASLRIHG